MAAKIGILFDPAGTSTLEMRAALDGVADIVWVVHDGQDGGRVPRALLERMGPVVDVASDDLDAAAAALRRAQVSGLVAFSDADLMLTSKLRELLSLPGYSPQVASAIRNKFLQRQALRVGNVAQPDFWHLPNGLDGGQLDRVAATVRYPAMVKPVEGAGSQGVTRVDSPAQLLAAYRADVEQLAEEYMVETADRDMRFSGHVAIDSAVTSAGISHAHIRMNFPATDAYRLTGRFIPARVSAALAQEILQTVAAGIRALGICESMVHTDVVITDNGPKIIEVNGRLSGNAPDYLRLISDVELRRSAVEVALGRPVKFETLVPVRGVGFIWDCNAPLQARRVVSVSGTDQLATSPWMDSVRIQAGPGTLLNHHGTFGVVSVLGHTTDHDQLMQAVELINNTVHITYE
ncbi:MAG: ATP-grasp domain-containing protein [Solirubrobacteraceae bacterium]